MSDQSAQEPTMEEILASIRRIISEDDAPAADAAAPAPEPAPMPFPVAPEEDDVLELTEAIDEPAPYVAPVETHGDLDVYEPPAAASEPVADWRQDPEPAYGAPPALDEPLISAATAAASASMFGQLSAAISMPASGRTLEDVVRELLRPLLKQWLDDNLTNIVETKVAEEVERITRGRVG
jgi:cell pole-organizing protein PopZ